MKMCTVTRNSTNETLNRSIRTVLKIKAILEEDMLHSETISDTIWIIDDNPDTGTIGGETVNLSIARVVKGGPHSGMYEVGRNGLPFTIAISDITIDQDGRASRRGELFEGDNGLRALAKFVRTVMITGRDHADNSYIASNLRYANPSL